MALAPLGAPAPLAPAPTAPRSRFPEVLRSHLAPAAPARPPLAAAPLAPAAPAPASASPPGVAALDRLQAAQRRMDEVLRLAESGRGFSPAELLALQAQVYRASQQLDLAGKVVEKATGGVKQLLQTPV